MKHIFHLLLCCLALPAISQNRYYPYAEGAKWGLTDESLAVLVAPQFDTSFRFVDNKFAIVQKKQRYGLISPDGNMILPCDYEALNYFGMNAGTAQLQGKYQLLNFTTGKPVSAFVFDKLNDYNYKDAIVLLVTQAGKKHFLNIFTGQPLNQKGYDDASFLRGYNNRGKIKTGNKYGLIDLRTGAIVLPAKYDKLEDAWQNGNRILVATTGKINTWFDEQGVVVPQPKKEKPAKKKPKKEEAPVMEETTLMESTVAMEGTADGPEMKKDIYIYNQGNNKWKLTLENRPLYTSGETEILNTFDLNGYTNLQKLSYDPYSRDVPSVTLKAVKNGKAGIINPAGTILAPFQYDDIIYTGSYYKTIRNNKIGILSRNLNEITPPVLQNIYNSDPYLRAWLVEMPNGKKGYMDMKSGKIFIPGIQLTSN
ncbi:WG repeat-containing protein [Chitinophaga sp. GbtcB8]|uniref:WG repeat-containing protein n=1 Tax=Chitinophaga sp. GbtcB8 TaxID=2824753 RepID=UPI001C2F73C1|nr:WG repeat-containing protein [Chitinophaga sp. GbtcB8]